jgi:methionyl-tRNA formyltransferase
MKKLKIGYFADGPWSHQAFNKLVQNPSIQFQFIVPRYDTKDIELEELSKLHKIDYFKNKNINSQEFIDIIKQYECDIFISLSFNQIFKSTIINLPPLKTINVHCGKLPFYRGRNILNWALINDETDFGITVHYVDEGIDTGDIILQKIYTIEENDNYGSLLNKAYEGCAEILHEAIINLQTSNFKPISQNTIHPTGFYCGIRGEGDEIINWNQTSRQIFNFIRAVSSPGPIATTKCNGEIIKINNSKYLPDVPKFIGTPGQIIGKVKDGHFLVKTVDSFIEIFEINSNLKLKIGNKLT